MNPFFAGTPQTNWYRLYRALNNYLAKKHLPRLRPKARL
jgi:hypothetical protein